MKTIHLIFNAHLDPVWLWPWSAGLDEVLNTTSAVCDLLDRHPDLTFTRGESWFYEQLEKTAPVLLKRVLAHVTAGRWEVVGGWYVQPDCNLPSLAGLQKQIDIGRADFTSRFGIFPTTAYNVDSFGHAASLPDLMLRNGQRHYIMMRPQAHEMNLPARLFRWQGTDGAITTFRIAPEYCTPQGVTLDHVKCSLTALPPGCDHTMCFVGVGDHGGGPTESLIDWCRTNANAIPGAQMIFSSPAKFFDAIAPLTDSLPTVSGELQQHAIGCYSVHRRIKNSVRRAEDLLTAADRCLDSDPDLAAEYRPLIDRAWRSTCFNAFHDTLGGTCIPSANQTADWQTGSACAIADEVLNLSLRRRLADLPPDPHQRIIIANPTAHDFEGIVEHEPWLELTQWADDWALLDEADNPISFQQLESEAARDRVTRLAFPLAVPAGSLRIVRIANGKTASPHSPIHDVSMESGIHPFAPSFLLRAEPTDTWAHQIDRFAGKVVERLAWSDLTPLESGPVAEIWRTSGIVGQSPVSAEWRLYPHQSFFDLHLSVEWREQHAAFQLVFQTGSQMLHREDGIPGATLQRPMDGRELPLRDFSRITQADGTQVGIAAPAAYSISGTDEALTLTLLRSPILAHHEPHDGQALRRVFADQGHQDWRIRIFPPQPKLEFSTLESAAHALSDPLRLADLTIGMPLRPLRKQWTPTPS